MQNVYTAPLFFNITMLVVIVPIVWWLLKSRQLLTVFFVLMLLLLFFINNPLPETRVIVLQSMPCEFPGSFFLNDVLNKITDRAAVRQLLSCYMEDAAQDKFVLKQNLSAAEKKALPVILEEVSCSLARVTLWAPAFLEHGAVKAATIAIEYRGGEAESAYRLSAGSGENVLMSSTLAARNANEDKAQSRDYHSNILFQGIIKKDEILSKQVSLFCLKQDWQECELKLKLERFINSGASPAWVEEGCEKFTIKEAYKINSLMPQVSGIIALVTSLMTILLKLIDTWQKKQEQT